MNKLSKQLFLINLFLVSSLFAAKPDCKNKGPKSFEHNIELQLADPNGFFVDNTEFSVNLDVVKNGELVTILWPTINFQTGQISDANTATVDYAGGYLYTVDKFLPEEVRPQDLMPRTVIGASNNGLSPVFSFTQTSTELPVPPFGYQVQVTNAGAFQILGAGTFNNIIKPGPQILLPGSISYLAKPKQKLCKNVQISTGATNTTQFDIDAAENDGVRDSHVCDAHAGIVAYAWSDNSNIDQTINTLNLMVAIGTVDAKGELQMLPPVQLTDLPEDAIAWDTAIAINRLDPSNIVVSYGYINFNGGSKLCRAVSFDYGQTWGGVFDGVNPLPTNGPLAEQPIGGFGDARGVSADKDGNFWYSATERGSFKAPIFYESTNGGLDFGFAFVAPTDFIATRSGDFDYPQYCFGYDDQDNYGVYYVADFAELSGDKITQVGFIPSDANIQPTVTLLPQLLNSIEFAGITASDDGRVWLYGNPDTNGTPISPAVVSFKSTGSLNENYAGVWQVAEINFFDLLYTASLQPSGVVSQPVYGFIQTSMQSIIYDNKREALYAIATQQVPNKSQDMRIFFTISRDNGQTWSKPLNINNDNFANRGFQSMALDTERGDLVFGWYDGRNDADFEALDYYGAVIPAATLDKLVNAIPLSNPTYIVPAVN